MTNTRLTAGAVTLALTAAAGLFFFTSSRASTAGQTGDLDVACGESHRAVVRQLRNGDAVRISVDCVSSGVFAASSPNGVVPMTTAYYPDAVANPRVVPAVYVPPPAAAPAVESVAPARSTTRAATPPRSSQPPSWQKRALVIGASAGAGAGVGALIGGRKGALIGAAAGGGGATVVDLIRNR
jgi:hypothetical protein